MLMRVNPFAQLIISAPPRKPKSTQVSIVINGKRVTSMREVKRMASTDEDIDVDAIRLQLRRLRDQVRYQRIRLDPEKMAKRKAYYEANREKVREWKRRYDRRNRKRMRKQQADWAARERLAHPDRVNARSRRYYAKNRELVLERKRQVAEARKGSPIGPRVSKPHWTAHRQAWLEEVERNPMNKRARGQVGAQCFTFGWTEWRRNAAGTLPHEQLTDVGAETLAQWRANAITQPEKSLERP